MCKVDVRSLHDRKGVEISLPDDLVDLNLSEAEELLNKLKSEIKKAKENDPKAPAPLDLSEDFPTIKKSKEFAVCGRKRNDDDSCAVIAEYDFDLSCLRSLRDWIDKVIQYHSEVQD